MHNERAIWTPWLLALTATVAATIPAPAQEVEPPPFESRFVEANGIRLQYMDFGGSGLPLIFVQDIHNYFEDEEPYFRDVWAGFYARFTDDHRVLATVKRGYGESDDPGWGYDVATQSEDLLGLMDALQIRRAVLVGRVPATQDLTWIAEHHPERIAGLVYLGNPIVLHAGRHPEARLFSENYARGSCDLEERAIALAGARTSWRPHFLDDEAVRIDVPALRFTHPVYDRRSMALQRLDRLDEIAAEEPGCPGEARSLEYFRALAADPDRRAALRRVLEESDPSVPIDEGLERAFGASMRTVVEPDLEGGWPAFHDFIEPHVRRFIAEVLEGEGVPAGAEETSWATAPSADTVATARLIFHQLLHPVGEETYTLTREGSGYVLRADLSHNDRGTTTHRSVALRVGPELEPAGFRLTETADRAATETVVDVNGRTAVLTDPSGTRDVPVPDGFFTTSAFAPHAVQMMLVRYWLRQGRPDSIPILPHGQARVRFLGQDTLAIADGARVLDRYHVRGVRWGGQTLWLDEDDQLVAAISFDFNYQVVREG